MRQGRCQRDPCTGGLARETYFDSFSFQGLRDTVMRKLKHEQRTRIAGYIVYPVRLRHAPSPRTLMSW